MAYEHYDPVFCFVLFRFVLLDKQKPKDINTTKPPLQIFSQGSKKNTARNINIMRDKN